MTTWVLFVMFYSGYGTFIGGDHIPGWVDKAACEKAYQDAYGALGENPHVTHVCIEQEARKPMF